MTVMLTPLEIVGVGCISATSPVIVKASDMAENGSIGVIAGRPVGELGREGGSSNAVFHLTLILGLHSSARSTLAASSMVKVLFSSSELLSTAVAVMIL